uniref:Uncharacterized protein n=1 Tax=Rhizophora mucronata TaxID=61149 RepID=A0A2P2J924_RHIMU
MAMTLHHCMNWNLEGGEHADISLQDKYAFLGRCLALWTCMWTTVSGATLRILGGI